jgi:PadR family transcriptional regulator, regulatory protein PadR
MAISWVTNGRSAAATHAELGPDRGRGCHDIRATSLRLRSPGGLTAIPAIGYMSKRKVCVDKAKSDLPQGTLDLLILKIAALGPLHGYAIAQRLQQISQNVVHVQQGSLYPALHRLENRRLLAAEWKLSDTGRDAKFYRITKKGRAHLGAETASWHRLTEAVGLILETAEGEAS